jgi:hypothetical protein
VRGETAQRPRTLASEMPSSQGRIEHETHSLGRLAERVGFELSVGESRANPNRPPWQQRQAGAAASSSPGARSLRFGCVWAERPRPRGIAEISQPTPKRTREVSAPPDSMAEREGFEPSVPLQVHTLSKRAPSTTRPSLRIRSLDAPGGADGIEALLGHTRVRRLKRSLKERWRRGRDSNPR